jgi:hypothetical protein
MATSEQPLAFDEFKFIREEIRYQNTWLGMRLSWYVAAQSFLMTAFAISSNGAMQKRQCSLRGPIERPLRANRVRRL